MKISDTQTAYGINASPNADGSYDPRFEGPDKAQRERGRPPTPTTEEHKKIAEDWYTWGFQVGIEVSVPLQAAGTQIGRETVTIYVPEGYDSAGEFLRDCGFEQACPSVQPASQDRPGQGYWPREMIDEVAAHGLSIGGLFCSGLVSGLPHQTCNCLMCLAEGENSPHRRRRSR